MTTSPTRTAARTVRLTQLSPCWIENELQADPQHRLLVLDGKRWAWTGFVDGSEGDLVLVGVARALVDHDPVEPAVARDLEPRSRLLARNRPAVPSLLDLLMDLPDVVGVRKIGDVQRDRAGAGGGSGGCPEGRRWRRARLALHGRRRRSFRRGGARGGRQLLAVGTRQRRRRTCRQAAIGQSWRVARRQIPRRQVARRKGARRQVTRGFARRQVRGPRLGLFDARR